jgi:hypothetical protein
MNSKIIPVLRIFDYQKMVECYVEWLGFSIDWEHRFNENAPVYLSVTKGDIKKTGTANPVSLYSTLSATSLRSYRQSNYWGHRRPVFII